ncbi:hypothetical protein C8T65DRAFT_142600 [Cerioporus squamosus]|nr:hypothetical protein C8T65DRAFT_142600 [Cerioporus squamosus]
MNTPAQARMSISHRILYHHHFHPYRMYPFPFLVNILSHSSCFCFRISHLSRVMVHSHVVVVFMLFVDNRVVPLTQAPHSFAPSHPRYPG